ncbi:regulator of microtubule dynamics protein 1-like [Gadus chalcogrammus]|uniref:regulator of microtubule dynamics protein 1-like n=1 Tax=Gadus chalcogrammus TaxID=1042646 RepID=UPI0024C4BA72|nr:regulator of microtubule dynamics protein 1-like [Gadus chalcogrammus]
MEDAKPHTRFILIFSPLTQWYGILLSDLGDYMGTKHKLEKSLVIRKHLERAKELNPNDPTTVYILGYWCFSFAELSWSLRKLAPVIFGTPPTSSYEEALEFFLKAEEVKPGFYSKNLLMLGKTYLALKDKENAHLWLTKARDYRPITTEDKEVGLSHTQWDGTLENNTYS